MKPDEIQQEINFGLENLERLYNTIVFFSARMSMKD